MTEEIRLTFSSSHLQFTITYKSRYHYCGVNVPLCTFVIYLNTFRFSMSWGWTVMTTRKTCFTSDCMLIFLLCMTKFILQAKKELDDALLNVLRFYSTNGSEGKVLNTKQQILRLSSRFSTADRETRSPANVASDLFRNVPACRQSR